MEDKDMKMKYIKPESTVIEVQSENCMQHPASAVITGEGGEEKIPVIDDVPDDDGWNTKSTGLGW